VARGINGGTVITGSATIRGSATASGSTALGLDLDFFVLFGLDFIDVAAPQPPKQQHSKARRSSHCQTCSWEPQEPDSQEPDSPDRREALDPVLKEPAGPDPDEAKDAEESPEPDDADESSAANTVVVVAGVNGRISVKMGQAFFGMAGCTLMVDLSDSVWTWCFSLILSTCFTSVTVAVKLQPGKTTV